MPMCHYVDFSENITVVCITMCGVKTINTKQEYDMSGFVYKQVRRFVYNNKQVRSKYSIQFTLCTLWNRFLYSIKLQSWVSIVAWDSVK